MGSHPSSRPRLPENSASGSRIYTSFCLRETTTDVSMSNWIECYNPFDNTWSRVSSLPGLMENHVLKDFGMVSIGEWIFIVGGRLCRKDSFELDVKVISTVLRYDTRSDQWFVCASLQVPRYNFACTVCDNKIYVAGGQSTLASARGISSVELYDPFLDKWTPLPSLRRLRYKCVGVTWQERVHVVGGFVEKDDMDSIGIFVDRSSAEVYDERTEKWDLAVGMWQLDVPPNQIVAVNERLYSSGDCLNAWKGHIEAYDGELNIWYIVDGSQLKIPLSTSYGNEERNHLIQRLYLTMAPIGTHLYFLVGYRMATEISSTISTVHMFDTSATIEDAWRTYEPIQDEREKELCGHCCVVQL